MTLVLFQGDSLKIVNRLLAINVELCRFVSDTSLDLGSSLDSNLASDSFGLVCKFADIGSQSCLFFPISSKFPPQFDATSNPTIEECHR